MNIRYISVYLGYESGADEQTIDRFNFNIRFIENYLSKNVRQLKLDTFDGYNMIFIDLLKEEKEDSISNCFKSLNINLKYEISDISYLNSLTNLVERYEYYLSLFERGWRKAAAEGFNIHLDELLKLNQQFRDAGYKNEWLWKKKMLRDHGLYVFFNCYFTTFEFRLEIEAYDLKKTRQIAKGTIFKSMPDEICFSKDFKKLMFLKSDILILDFLDYPQFSVSIPLLKQGIVEVEYLNTDKENYDNDKYIKRITW